MQKSKEQAKTVKIEMLEFVSPVALLKSTKHVEKIRGAETWAFVEKKLMDLGGQAVYPSQPFKYGYKRIYPNKKHLIKNHIGVRAPLTDEQLKMVAEFVGLAGLEQCNSDMKYLRLLKSLLVQRCNVQNPDELDWNDTLAHIEVFPCKIEQKTKLGEGGKTGDREEIPPPTIEKAYRSYEYAISQNPQLANAKDREAYDWLTEKDNDDYPLPVFETWQRYLRAGRKYYGASKNTRRAGRTPKTAISVTDPAVHQITSKFDK
jgi:hypothetical protein